MQLFVNPSTPQGVCLQLLSAYLGLLKKRIKVISLSKGAIQLVRQGKFKCPMIITQEGKSLQDFTQIVEFICKISGWSQMLLGGNQKQMKEILQFISTTYTIDNINKHLKTKSFLVGYRVTAADIVQFSRISGNFIIMSQEEKYKYSNLLRWYYLIQNQETILQFIRQSGLFEVTRPVKRDIVKVKAEKKQKQKKAQGGLENSVVQSEKTQKTQKTQKAQKTQKTQKTQKIQKTQQKIQKKQKAQKKEKKQKNQIKQNPKDSKQKDSISKESQTVQQIPQIKQ